MHWSSACYWMLRPTVLYCFNLIVFTDGRCCKSFCIHHSFHLFHKLPQSFVWIFVACNCRILIPCMLLVYEWYGLRPFLCKGNFNVFHILKLRHLVVYVLRKETLVTKYFNPPIIRAVSWHLLSMPCELTEYDVLNIASSMCVFLTLLVQYLDFYFSIHRCWLHRVGLSKKIEKFGRV